MNELIIAAGGVVWRESKDSKIELAIIHRPKYDDWTFPKGKLDLGEELISGAYREILEETGLDIELGPFLGAVEYESFGEAKHVSYWAAKALSSSKEFHPNNEADLLEWHEVDSAREKLSRETDREILEKFIKSYLKKIYPYYAYHIDNHNTNFDKTIVIEITNNNKRIFIANITVEPFI